MFQKELNAKVDPSQAKTIDSKTSVGAGGNMHYTLTGSRRTETSPNHSVLVHNAGNTSTFFEDQKSHLRLRH